MPRNLEIEMVDGEPVIEFFRNAVRFDDRRRGGWLDHFLPNFQAIVLQDRRRDD